MILAVRESLYPRKFVPTKLPADEVITIFISFHFYRWFSNISILNHWYFHFLSSFHQWAAVVCITVVFGKNFKYFEILLSHFICIILLSVKSWAEANLNFCIAYSIPVNFDQKILIFWVTSSLNICPPWTNIFRQFLAIE